MLSTPKSKGELFLASSLRDGLEDNDIRQVKTLLLSKEADPNVLIPTHGISPFHLVIGNDSEKFAEEVTKLFLRHGGNPNVRSSDGMTPVHVAAAWGRVAVLELLLANGGDPLCLDDDGRSPFHYAFDGNFYNAVTMLGKYCGMSQDEEEEDEPKYKLTLDKILINKGNVVAEYVTSEDSCSVSTRSEWNERFDDVESEATSRTKRPDFENPSPSASPVADEFSHLNTNNITLRRNQKRRAVSPAAANLDGAFDGSSVAAERLLIGEIISRLSDTCANDSLIAKDPSATSGNPSVNDATQNAPEIKRMRSFLPPPRYRSDKANSKEKPPRGLAVTSPVSKSPNLRITENAKWRDWKGDATPPLRSARPEARTNGANSAPRYRGEKSKSEETPPRGLVDRSTIGKSPNLRLTEDTKATQLNRKSIASPSYTCKSRYWIGGNAAPPLRSGRIKGTNSTPRYRGEKSKSVETPPRGLVDRSTIGKSPNLRLTEDTKATQLNRKLIASPSYTCKSRYWIGGNATPPLRSGRIKGTNSTPRYRSEKSKSVETPPRRLVDRSTIGKSPNLRLTEDTKATQLNRKLIASPSYTCKSRYWIGGNATPPLRSGRIKGTNSTPRYRSEKSKSVETPPRRLADRSTIGKSPNLRLTEDTQATQLNRKSIASPSYTCKSRYWISGNATPPLRSGRIKGTNSTPRYRGEKSKSVETPPRRLADTSIISKSPNLRIREDEKTPTPPRRKMIASPTYTCRSRHWNGGNAARPEARVKSASSTPKRKHNGSRLHKIPKFTRTAERPIGVPSRRAEEVTPTMLDRTYSKDRFGVLTYSPDAEVHARGVDRKYLARSVAVNLDDRMYDDNRETEGRSDSPSDSTGVEGSNDATRRLKPPRIYNNFKAEAASEAKSKGCNVASSKLKAASPREPLGKKVNNVLISSPSLTSLGNEKVNNGPVSRLLTQKARGVDFSPKSGTNFRGEAEASSKFETASPHEPLENEIVNNALVSRLLTPKTRGVDFSPKSKTNFRAEAEEKPAAIFDSPGSSRAISVSSTIGKRYWDRDDKEETQHWLEVEEACISRCVTPPASVSMIVADDSPSSGHTSQTTFYSDYGSEDSYGSDFIEASVNYSTVLQNTRMTAVSRSESFVSVEEEYTYEDAEEGVVFIERRLCVIPASARDDWNPVKTEGSLIDRFDDLSIAPSDRTSISSQSEPLSRSMLDDEILRARLTALGEQPGPITKTTYDVYLKRLWRLERDRKRTTGKPLKSPREPRKQTDRVVVSSAIPDFLLATDWTTKLQFYQKLEEQAFKEYAIANPTRKYRGGISKTSFCYLLLDPRVTRDLPRSSAQLSDEDRWRRFLEGVFYVGQGKAARPAHHLYDAFGVWSKRKRADNINRKIRRILDIWEEGQGIVCLHVFYHTMVEEACSREASMIDALDTTHLTNSNRGTYYGYTTTMSAQEKRSLGKYLLYKAMEIFMHEGERQLFPRNVTM